jgi:hypothetical protein
LLTCSSRKKRTSRHENYFQSTTYHCHPSKLSSRQ